ncbi:hypothetical protein DEU56DRAFT_699008, partial [Suillus clintonianus]|uniref:uncharacterized protein n=1 Tax=Suillus clintonianus TaxID=1904413 RepID=UPI001B885ABE
EETGNNEPRTDEIGDVPLGDPLAERAEHLLASHAPYPGDDLEKEESFSGQRFIVYRTSDTHHVILDGARRSEEDLLVPSDLLANPKFLIGNWYTTHLAKRLLMPKHLVRLMHNGDPMGDPISSRVGDILNSERNFP